MIGLKNKMIEVMDALKQYIDLYAEHAGELQSHAPEVLNKPRAKALDHLQHSHLPEIGDEGYPALSVEEMFAPDFGVNLQRRQFGTDPAQIYKCGLPNVSTLLAIVVNDTFYPTRNLLRNLPEGVEMMSLARAAKEMPELVGKYYDKLVDDSATASLNTLLAQDGVFFRVKKGVNLDKPLQLVNVFNAPFPMLGVRRILIVIEEGAKASLLICDHTAKEEMNYLSSQVAEIFVERDASLDYYDLEETSAHTRRHSQVFVKQDENSHFISNVTTLIGGITRNSIVVEHIAEHAHTLLVGMAVAADNQIIDNATLIRHNTPKCESQQMFKYILEDNAKGQFFGRVVVDKKAKHTNAYQSNRNILASKTARMYTRPQLEIYCDDVKCSHGTTIGQIDQNALFYMRSRGIPEDEAKMMLMQAFMEEVIDTVRIDALKIRLRQLVQYRLAGHLEHCAECSLNEQEEKC